MKYNIEEINKLVEEGWLEVQTDPSSDLSIYNYSRKTQFEKNWNEITLNMRGTILDPEGNVIARGFPKFFNYEEHQNDKDIPWEDERIYIQDKADGSLGILFNYKGVWKMCTRGSFTSNQAIKGKEIFDNKYNNLNLNPKYTYLIEIIYPENRIVLDYKGEEKLIWLSIFEGNSELRYGDCLIQWLDAGIRNDMVNTIIVSNDININELKSRNIQNQEGYVLRFYPSNFRMKIKFADYVRLHSLMTNFSNVDIWKCLRDGIDINEMMKDIPDELDVWVKKIIRDLKYEYYRINEYTGKLFDEFMYGKYNDKEPETDKKKYAEWVNSLDYPLQIKGILFRIFDKKDYSKGIWNMIKPNYSKPFWNKVEDDF